jgi:hypothetical protein
MAQYRDAQEQRLARAADLEQRAAGLRSQLATLAARIDDEHARMRQIVRWLRLTPHRRAFWSGVALGLIIGLFVAARTITCP